MHTFGFRGEALNSLCALSNLTIITRTKSSINGTKIEYDQAGNIKNKKPCARSIGTSIVLEYLFNTLPVRHKEFLKNIRKEYNKLVYLIQSYCLISNGVKFTCFNTISGKCTKLMSTNSKNTLKDNIIEIFGIHSMNNLIKFEQINELTEEIKEEFNVLATDENAFEIDGYLSNNKNNFGRSAQDRQYLYVNKRPCDNQRVIKLINEVYRQQNQTQYPMFILNISLNSKYVDVNVTPDKLKIFLKNENILLAILKQSLKGLYAQTNQRVDTISDENQQESNKKVYNFQFYKQTNDEKSVEVNKENNDKSNVTKKRTISENDEDIEKTKDEILSVKKNKLNTDDFDLCPKYKQTKLNSIVKERNEKEENDGKFVLIKTISSKQNDDCVKTASKIPNILFQNNIGTNLQLEKKSSQNENDKKLFDLNDTLSAKLDLHFNKDFNDDSILQSQDKIHDNLKKLGCNKYASSIDHDLEIYESEAEAVSQESLQITKDTINNDISDDEKSEEETKPKAELPKKKADESTKKPNTVNFDFAKNRKIKEINFSLDKLIKSSKSNTCSTQKTQLDGNKLLNIKFKPKVFDSKDAESELDRYIKKEDFKSMHVCGQFNKGFIVTRLEQDLFIVDQHAADEIYNFEQLQITNKIDKQRLLQPHYLELDPSSESLLIENEQLLEKAGYDMQVVKNRKAGNRIMLTSVPASKKQNKFFDSGDIDELLFILNENNISCCDESSENLDNLQKLHKVKPSSLRAMYASKACRKSIMIGDSLNKFEMKRIITHLSEIVKPWNCPHGRPTLRHLINLEMYKKISQN